MLFNHLKFNVVAWIGTHSMFLMEVFDVVPGVLDVLLCL